MGTVAPILGAITSAQEHLLYWVRIGSLLVGIAVGVVTFVTLLPRLRGALAELRRPRD